MLRFVGGFAALWVGFSLSAARADTPEEKEAVAAVEKLGGTVGRNDQAAGKPIVWVALDNGQATDEVLALVGKINGLEFLNLQSCAKITGGGLKGLKGLSKLNHLNLGRTQLTNADLKELKPLAALKILDLSNTPVTDDGLKELAALPKLQHLRLIGNKITDAGLGTLAKFNALTAVNLFQTEVTQAGADKLLKVKPKLALTR